MDPAVRATYLYVEQANKSRALNFAIEQLNDECLVFFSDDDIRFDVKVLKAYEDIATPGAGEFYGGPTEVDYQREPAAWLIPFLPGSARGWHLDQQTNWVNQPVFLGCNWAAFVGDLRAGGGFREQFGPGAVACGQELFMQRDLLACGLRGRYVPKAKVWHYVPAERCSPQWAANRSYKNGTAKGLKLRETNALKPALRWLTRHGLLLGRLCVRSLFLQDAESHFSVIYYYRRICGFWHGLSHYSGANDNHVSTAQILENRKPVRK